MKAKLYVPTRADWRAWLKEHHSMENEIWLVFYKKHTGKPSIQYTDSVQEALCFGWIDGIKKSIDDEKYAYRFTPRKAKSKWSPLNMKLAKKLIAEGKMSPAGLEVFNKRLEYDEVFLALKDAKELVIPSSIETSLKEHDKAWENFNGLAPGYRKQYLGWLIGAKKPETRERRLKEAISLLMQNKKLGMK